MGFAQNVFAGYQPIATNYFAQILIANSEPTSCFKMKVNLPIVMLFVGIAIGLVSGLAWMEIAMQQKAIEANVAEYVIDKTTGEVKFQYIKP